MKPRVRTNGAKRPIVTRDEVPPEVLASEFDWLDPDDQGDFFKYRGTWYELRDFVASNVTGWHGIAVQTYFSGVVMRFCDGNESVICGRASW